MSASRRLARHRLRVLHGGDVFGWGVAVGPSESGVAAREEDALPSHGAVLAACSAVDRCLRRAAAWGLVRLSCSGLWSGLSDVLLDELLEGRAVEFILGSEVDRLIGTFPVKLVVHGGGPLAGAWRRSARRPPARHPTWGNDSVVRMNGRSRLPSTSMGRVGRGTSLRTRASPSARQVSAALALAPSRNPGSPRMHIGYGRDPQPQPTN